MITVSILINGQPIFTRSAINTMTKDKSGRTMYKLDDGSCVMHHRDKGAVPLAIQMLKQIEEPKQLPVVHNQTVLYDPPPKQQ